MSSSPPPLVMAVPPVTPGRKWSSRPLAMASGLTTSAAMAFLVLVVHKLGQICDDFAMPLPGVTRAVVDLSYWLRRSDVWVVMVPLSIALPLVFVPLLPVPETESGRERIRRFATVVVTAWIVLVALLVVAGVAVPVLELIRSAGGMGHS